VENGDVLVKFHPVFDWRVAGHREPKGRAGRPVGALRTGYGHFGYACANRHDRKGKGMQVREGMSSLILTVGPSHTLREAARQMAERGVGAAVVLDPDQPGPGIITERDLLEAIGAGQDIDTETVGDHLSTNLTFASPGWSLETAAEAMVRGNFRHLVVVDEGETVGVLSMRDIVRCWTQAGATSEVEPVSQ
jgi:CBS domain-containing protein